MPDPGHVGRIYHAPGQLVEPAGCERFAKALAGADPVAEPGAVPPTYAAVYCLFPTMYQLFGDPEVGINLAGIIHGEQSFEFPTPVRPGDVVDASAEILSIEARRGMTFLTVGLSAIRQDDAATVCTGRSLMIIRGAA